MSTMKPFNKGAIDTVFYHGHCPDGFASAYVVWEYYRDQGITSPQFIPYYHSTVNHWTPEVIAAVTGKTVLLVDFSFSKTYLLKILEVCESLFVIDHHKTNAAELTVIAEENKRFSMDLSGCGLTWDYFFPTEPLPQFLAHVQDRDLWTWKLPGTKAFCTAFYAEVNHDFQQWHAFHQLGDDHTQLFIKKGEAMISQLDATVASALQNSRLILQHLKLNDGSTLDDTYVVVGYCNSCVHQSEIGSALMQQYRGLIDFAAVWSYDPTSNSTKYSLRSTELALDVGNLAKRLGGGGHGPAAGCDVAGLIFPLPLQTADLEGEQASVVPDHGCLKLLLDYLATKQNEPIDVKTRAAMGLLDSRIMRASLARKRITDVHLSLVIKPASEASASPHSAQ